MNESEKANVTIWDYLVFLLKWRRVIIVNILVVGIIVGIISFIVPKKFTASTTIFPPLKESFGFGGTSSLLGGLGALVGGGGGSGFSLPSFTTPSDIYAAIMQSRTVVERVIRENDLQEVFNYDDMSEELIKEVSGRTTINVRKNGMITLSFEADDPVTAALVANSYISILNDMNKKLSSSRAASTREFIARRLEKTQAELTAAEDDLRAFQEKYGAVDLTEQLKTQIQSAADLHSQMVLTEIELGVLLEYMSPDAAAVKKTQTKITQIKKQLKALDKGGAGADSSFMVLPFSEAPELGLELLRLKRELKIQESIFELLTTQYEQAKIEEAKDTPTIQVLDEAKPPERRSYPIRSFMVLTGMAGSFIFSIVVVFVVQYFNLMKIHNRELYDKFQAVTGMIHQDISHLGNRIFGRKKSKNSSGG
jgi:tyrosine-protein kinase Etk/Wzc